MNEQNEQDVIWKDIPGYEGLYQVSNDGRVFSERNGIELSQRCTPGGYKIVNLYKNAKQAVSHVHHLVAETFLGSRKKGIAVHHKNHDKTDNKVENLEYMPRGEHAAMHVRETHAKGKIHSFVPGHNLNVGEKNGQAKLDENKVREILRLSAMGVKQKDLAEQFHVSAYAIRCVTTRKLWRHVQTAMEAQI